MKKIFFIVFVFSILIINGCGVGTRTTTTNVQPQPHPDPAYSALDNYGQWIYVAGLGTVWRPYDENNWQPYYNGQWIWTDQGWMWLSNEPYGWIVYHYGNWDFTEAYGWIWIPNYVWEPARVRWYHSNGYIGWAPMPPPGVTSAAIIYNSGYVDRVWVIVPEQHFYNKHVGHYRKKNFSPDVRILRSSNGGRGPEIRNIEEVTHRRIEPVRWTRDEIRSGGRRLIKVRVPNNSNNIDRGRNNTGREEHGQTKPPAVNNNTPNSGSKTRTRNNEPTPPRKPIENAKPPTREKNRNNGDLRNNNGRNNTRDENINWRDPNNSSGNRNHNSAVPAKPKVPKKNNSIDRTRERGNSKNLNKGNVKNQKHEPAKNKLKEIERKKAEAERLKKEAEKRKADSIKKEKKRKEKAKNDNKQRERNN